MVIQTDTFLPIELVFNPNWWYTNIGISFDEKFYLDIETRIQNDVTMRRVLHERYGDLGLGEANPQPRPIIGSMHVAGGFVIPALLGSRIRFAHNEAPQPEPMHLALEQIESFEKPDWRNLYPMKQFIAQMDELQARFGYIVGDVNTDGLLNAAYHLYGQNLFADFYDAPERARRLMDMVGELIADIASYFHSRTGTYSISVNRMVAHFMPTPFLHANCSVQMISPKSYHAIQLSIEQKMAERMQPFGIHHCGSNLHAVASEYAKLSPAFVDVGWGSYVGQVREKLPDAFLNLRLSPVRMLECSPQEIAQDTETLLREAGSLENIGMCCINMDAGTPDENIFAMYEVIERYRKYGG